MVATMPHVLQDEFCAKGDALHHGSEHMRLAVLQCESHQGTTAGSISVGSAVALQAERQKEALSALSFRCAYWYTSSTVAGPTNVCLVCDIQYAGSTNIAVVPLQVHSRAQEVHALLIAAQLGNRTQPQ